MNHLKTINLTFTPFNEEHLTHFKNFQNLEKVFLFNPSLKKNGSMQLDQSSIIIDYGNYDLPKVTADNIVY